MNPHSHRTLYRSRRGKIFGVFQGIANNTGLDTFWMRLIAVLIVLFTGIFPMVLLYIAAALLMKLEPEAPLGEADEEFYNSVTTNKTLAMKRLDDRIESLDRRARRIESIVMARGTDWDRRMADSE